MVDRNSVHFQRKVIGWLASFWIRGEQEPYTHRVLMAGTHISVNIEGVSGKHFRGDRDGKSDRVLLHVLR
jgi:hypothetical protein